MPHQYPSSRNKQALVISELTQTAYELGPGNKFPTAQELADRFGITLTTLDRALNKLEAKGVIHRRQGSGIFVSESLLQKKVGLIFGHNVFQLGSSAFYLLLLQHCEKRANVDSEHFSFYLMQHDSTASTGETLLDRDLRDSILQGRLDGLLLCGVNNPAHLNWIKSRKIDTVAIARTSMFPSVDINMNEMLDQCLGGLVRRGCKRIGILGVIPRHMALAQSALEKHPLELVESWTCCPTKDVDPPADAHEDLGRHILRKLLEENGTLPDGLLITDDVLARGVFLELKKAGFELGKDLHAATHANRGSLALEYWQDRVILSEFDPAEIVDHLFTMLETLMNGKTLRKKHVTVNPTLRDPFAA